MSKHKRTHTLALHPTPSAHHDREREQHEASDFIRAESEGMLTTPAPGAQKPAVPWRQAILSYLDVSARSLKQITLPALRRSVTEQITARPFASIGFAMGIGAIATLIIRPKLRDQ